jgi:chromosome segregation ATPase
MAGKAEYETALNKYNEEIAKLEETISSATVEVETLDSAFKDIDEQLKKLSLKDEEAAFESLKKRLKELGVEGIENAKDLDTLREAI